MRKSISDVALHSISFLPSSLAIPNFTISWSIIFLASFTQLTGWEMIRLLMEPNLPPSLCPLPARGREARKTQPVYHFPSHLGISKLQSVGVKEGLSCVFSRAKWRGKARKLALP